MSVRFVVSACLAGLDCRYDGGSCQLSDIKELVAQGTALPICPEQLGGLPTPRPWSEIVGGDGRDVIEGRAKVFSQEGREVTEQFVKGAQETLKLALLVGAKEAILKQKSPACGCGQIYHKGKLIHGDGVTSALLKNKGIKVRAVD